MCEEYFCQGNKIGEENCNGLEDCSEKVFLWEYKFVTLYCNQNIKEVWILQGPLSLFPQWRFKCRICNCEQLGDGEMVMSEDHMKTIFGECGKPYATLQV